MYYSTIYRITLITVASRICGFALVIVVFVVTLAVGLHQRICNGKYRFSQIYSPLNMINNNFSTDYADFDHPFLKIKLLNSCFSRDIAESPSKETLTPKHLKAR